MCLGFFEVLHGRLRVVQGLSHSALHLDQLLLLSVGLHIDLFGDLVDISHNAMNLVELLLPLLDHLGHVIRLHLHFKARKLGKERVLLFKGLSRRLLFLLLLARSRIRFRTRIIIGRGLDLVKSLLSLDVRRDSLEAGPLDLHSALEG